MRCLECGSEMRITDEPITELFKGEEYTVCGIERHVCDVCGNDEMSVGNAEALSRNLAEQYAHAHGLLSPGEIKSARKSMGLTQKEFEKLVGVSSPTASRWESGAVQQSKPTDILIRVLVAHPDARAEAMERAEVQPRPSVVISTETTEKAASLTVSGSKQTVKVGNSKAARTTYGGLALDLGKVVA